ALLPLVGERVSVRHAGRDREGRRTAEADVHVLRLAGDARRLAAAHLDRERGAGGVVSRLVVGLGVPGVIAVQAGGGVGGVVRNAPSIVRLAVGSNQGRAHEEVHVVHAGPVVGGGGDQGEGPGDDGVVRRRGEGHGGTGVVHEDRDRRAAGVVLAHARGVGAGGIGS